MDIRTKGLDLQLELLDNPNSDEEQLLIVRSAKAVLISKIESKEYKDGYHDQMVKNIQDEAVAERYISLSDRYPFLEDFTLGEFVAFEVSAKEFFESKTKRKRGRPKKTEEDNAKQIQNDVTIISEKYQGLRWNRMTDQFEYLKIKEETGKIEFHATEGDELNQLSVQLAVEHGIFIPSQRARDAFIYVAKQNSYEPQKDMMDWCRQQHPSMSLEDAREFLGTLGERLLGYHEEEPIVCGEKMRNRFFARWLIAMAFLARNPGETLQWLPIIVGAQGCGKSQLCTHLIPHRFKDLFQQMTLPIETIKREPYQLHIGFLLEMPEIDAQMRNQRSIEPMKNLVTTRVDNCRKPYAPQPVKLVRRFGLIGTTNRADLFQDGTGERRYMPLQVPHGFEIPWEEVRDGLNVQLWAAADIIAETYDAESRHLRGFTDEETKALSDWQQNYTQVDPWETKLMDFCRLRREFVPSMALSQIGIEESRQTTQDVSRLNNLMRKLFGEKNARWGQVRRDGRRQYMWQILEMPGIDTTDELTSQDLQEFAAHLKEKVDF